ncbi:MAG: hypothetical protein HYZ21_08195 [Chloroflexi bacterium]|nr:hypothetical protein [Chloroflexota bacterium]
METKIIEAFDSPKELESLFRENPDQFLKAFPSVFAKHPESTILQVWQERLRYESESEKRKGDSAWSFKNILMLIVLTAIAGTIFKLPDYFESINYSFYERNIALVFIVPLIAYFVQRTKLTKFTVLIFFIAASTLLYLNLLPSGGDKSYEFWKMYRAFDDAITNAEIHIPLFLWLLTGVAFAGKDWKNTSARMGFLRYNGEVIIYTTILIIGGAILASITLALLEFIEKTYELSLWYQDYVIIYGVVSTPIIATFLLDKVIDKRLNIAPTIAKFFTPLFLITTLVYLIIMVIYQKNPFGDREYLMALNILLIIVLGLLIFTIAERNATLLPSANDYLNIGLACAIIILDAIALSATLFRSASDVYGLTPNRIAILGINLLVFIHLTGILVYYVRFIWTGKPFEKLENWIAGYLPYYAIWAILVSVMLPVFFWYK